MSSDLERVVSEDETARAGADEARARSERRIEQVRDEIARARRATLDRLERELETAIAAIAAAGDREIERRRAARDACTRDRAAHAATQIEDAAERWTQIVRTGHTPGGRR